MISPHAWGLQALMSASEDEMLETATTGLVDVSGKPLTITSMFCRRCGVPFTEETDDTECGVTAEPAEGRGSHL
ncbi:hypothetical protein ACFV1N_25250 [Streptosporangium canum]|uniref:hypothetical protein n=1 Tax=Streptosporangium canum TaxID=324952 RepID=UPI003693E96F